MTDVVLPADLQAWAEAEVASGRAESVERVVEKAVAAYRKILEDFRDSLDAAEAEITATGGIELEDAFDYVEARMEARAAFAKHWTRRAKRA